MNIFKWPFKIITTEKFDETVQKAINQANGELVEKLRGFPEFDSYLNPAFETYEQKEASFNAFFEKKKVKSEATKRLLMSALDNVPEVDMSFEELYLIQDAIWTKFGTDPLVQGAVDNFVDYVIGTGVFVTCPVEPVNEAFRGFIGKNKWFLRQKDIVKQSFIDGEHFTLLFNNDKGDVYVRKCHPRSIEAMETASTDIEVLYSIYRRLYKYDDQGNPARSDEREYIQTLEYEDLQNAGLGYNPSAHTGQFKENCVVSMVKFNDFDKMRGFPPLKRILKWSKLYENFIMDRLVLNHERAKIVWIKKYAAKPRDPLPSKPYKAPEGGTMLIEKDGITYRTEKPNLDSSEAKEDGLGLLYYIATSTRFPLHILNQRTDQQVYASIRKADTPFQKMIESAQYFYAIHFEDIYRYFLKLKVKSKELKPDYEYSAYAEDAILTAVKQVNDSILEGKSVKDIKAAVGKTLEEGMTKVKCKTVDLPISQDFPQMMLQDPKEMAEVLKIHNEIGIASKATISGKAGYNWKKEFPKIMAETAIALETKKKETEATTIPKEPESKPKPLKEK